MQHERFIQQTIGWIELHLHETITAQDISRVSGFSPYHFHRLFQKAIGMSTAEYIRSRRLAGAASQLLHSDARIIDIAFYYRFESQEAFTRTFKQAYQLPPGRFRKLMGTVTQKEETLMATPSGWFLSGSHPECYGIGTDLKRVHQGRASGYIRSIKTEFPEQFATMMQQFKAERYLGKRIQLRGFIQTKNVEQFSGLWMRVDNSAEDVLQFDNMSDRPITGTTLWNHYSIVLDVPENSAAISFGILLAGAGEVWIDSLSFQVVDKSVPTTHMETGNELPDAPSNLSFEDQFENMPK